MPTPAIVPAASVPAAPAELAELAPEEPAPDVLPEVSVSARPKGAVKTRDNAKANLFFVTIVIFRETPIEFSISRLQFAA
jgi:hypothetical protein